MNKGYANAIFMAGILLAAACQKEKTTYAEPPAPVVSAPSTAPPANPGPVPRATSRASDGKPNAGFVMDPREEKKATDAAHAWLRLIDSEKYAESWTGAASYFKSRVDEATWSKQIQAVRGPLGALNSRKFKAEQYTTSAPGAPDGHYLILQFATSFANKANAVETVTPMLDADGQWRVSGYFIR